MSRVDAPAAAAILSAAERNDVDEATADGNRCAQQQVVHFVRRPSLFGLPVDVSLIARERQLRRRDHELTVLLNLDSRVLAPARYPFGWTRQIHARVVARSLQGDFIRRIRLTGSKRKH